MKLQIAHWGYTTKIRGDGTKNYYLSIDEWTPTSLIRHKLYHRYDMIFPTGLPRWRRFADWLHKKHGAQVCMGFEGDRDHMRLRDRIVTWEYNQDMRCYRYSTKCRHLITLDISAEQRASLGKDPYEP